MLCFFQKAEEPDKLVMVSDSNFEVAAKAAGYNKDTDGCWFLEEEMIKPWLGHDDIKVYLRKHRT